MNYNEEIEKELKPLGLGGRLFEIPEEDRGTPKDWAELEQNVDLHARENEIMMEKSIINAKKSLSVG